MFLCLQQIVEYDVLESLKESRGLVIAFHKRIFQSALPVSMTLVYNSKAGEDQLLIADTDMKFKLFDKNTFEILATFLGPIYDSNVQQFVSIYGATTQNDVDGLKVPLSAFLFKLYPYFMFFFLFVQDTSPSHAKFFVFSTERNICVYALSLPIDGNPFRSLGLVGHSGGIKSIKVDSTRRRLFTIGNNCQSLFVWQINTR